MSNKILVTDSLFITAKHVQLLEDAGFEVERLDKPCATEEEVCQAIRGKVGYILGGLETITEKVIEAADELKAIMVAGTDWQGFIPAHELATQKGIAIGSALYLNAYAVAEFGMTMSLMMCRDAIALARGGEKTFETTVSLSELSVGVVGMGHIGTEYSKMLKGMGVANIQYFNRSRKPDLELELGLVYKEKSDLLVESDLLFIALPDSVGEKFFSADDVASIKNKAIIISISNPGQFELESLYGRLVDGSIRVAFDGDTKDERFKKLPLNTFYSPNESTAFNTNQAIQAVNDCCVGTIKNLLSTGMDPYRVN